MIAIIDYGVGNIFSLSCSFKYIGADAVLTADRDTIAKADRIILPGVGAFGDAAQKLKNTGLWDVVKEEASRKPILGICLGMQLLLQKSYEFGEHEGLGLISGSVDPIADVIPADYKIPHIGWNPLHFPKDKPVSPLFKNIHENDCVYFVHSFYASHCASQTIATTEYGAELTAAVSDGKFVHGVQFHPEKSGDVGLAILRGFCEL